jgi:hypothetical protein
VLFLFLWLKLILVIIVLEDACVKTDIARQGFMTARFMIAMIILVVAQVPEGEITSNKFETRKGIEACLTRALF